MLTIKKPQYVSGRRKYTHFLIKSGNSSVDAYMIPSGYYNLYLLYLATLVLGTLITCFKYTYAIIIIIITLVQL